MKRSRLRPDRVARSFKARWKDRLEVEPLEPRILPAAALSRAATQVFDNPVYGITAQIPAINDPSGSNNVFQPDIFVDGYAPAGSTVWLAKGPRGYFTNVAQADFTGHYAFEVEVPRGRTELRLFAKNPLNQYSAVTRLQVSAGNPILAWDAIALRAIRNVNLTGPEAARALAILHTAQYDAVAAVEAPKSAFRVRVAAPKGASAVAAADAAAATVLNALFPSQAGAFTLAMNQVKFGLKGTPAARAGFALGRKVGEATLATRANDGAALAVTYGPSDVPGRWRPTAPAFAPAKDPAWGEVTPFALADGAQFRPPAPPAVGTDAYDQALDEVASLGRSDSASRTPDQALAARHWSDGENTFTNPGHWNAIAEDLALGRKGSLIEDARLFAVLDVAMADAGIASQDAKSLYGTWRPISAIRQVDPTWTPLVATPATPAYPSGHAAFGAAAASVLAAEFGPDTRFTDNLYASSGNPRTYASFAAAAAEDAQSRVWAGDNFRFDVEQGRTLGEQVGAYVLGRFPKAK